MPIETICKGCARKLRVADEFAGRQARCPFCRTVYTVPKTQGSSQESGPPQQLWSMRTPDGKEYGPISKAELDEWVREGRVGADAQLRMEGESQWQAATNQYPSLAAKQANQNPFAETPQVEPANPYAAPAATPFRTARYTRPHRGGSILVLGVLGIICCQCLAPFAWAMGHADMNAIQAGEIDPAGRGMTQAGMIRASWALFC